jgi:molybdenum cofactor cytidylyltransferase
MSNNVAAILLAAGQSTRMGKDKLLLKHNGITFLEHSIDLLCKLPVYERIVVTTDARQKTVTIPKTIKLLINPHPERGQSSSIHTGIEAATGTHYLFLVADQPLLTAKDLQPLFDAVNSNPKKIIFPAIDSQPYSPTMFPGSFKDELLKLRGDNGGRKIRDAGKEHWHPIQPENPSNFTDIDRPEDYANLKEVRQL